MTGKTTLIRQQHSEKTSAEALKKIKNETQYSRHQTSFQGWRNFTTPSRPPNTHIRPFIIGGVPNQVYAPWLVALLDKDANGGSVADPYYSQFCSGTIISPRFALTAAHCFEGRSAGKVEILFNHQGALDPGVGERLEVDEVIQHPYFNPDTLENDIALVSLVTPIDYAETLGLGEYSDYYNAGQWATAVGWGATDAARSVFPRDLNELDLPIVDFNDANDANSWNGTLVETMLAAGYPEGGKDVCAGDSGGPLLGWDPDGTPKLIGVISFGPDSCGQPNMYGISTKIVSFVDWIESIVTPYFYAWAWDNQTFGWDTNTDLDGVAPDNFRVGFTNLMEYAIGTDPNVANLPSEKVLSLSPPFFYPGTQHTQISAVRIVRRKSGEINYVSTSSEMGGYFFNSPDSQLYDPVDITGFPDFEEVSVLGSVLGTVPREFFKENPILGTQYVPFIRDLIVWGNATDAGLGALNQSLQLRDLPYTATEYRYQREYNLTYLPAPTKQVKIQVDVPNINEFKPSVILYDSQGNVVQSAAPNSSRATITFTPKANETYVVRVTTQAVNQTGDFVIRAWQF